MDWRPFIQGSSTRHEGLIREMYDLLEEPYANLGRSMFIADKLEIWAEDAGFTNIQHERRDIPFGPWASDLKLVGLH
jgi:hypothetical protein